jgi:hypothetical protein
MNAPQQPAAADLGEALRGLDAASAGDLLASAWQQYADVRALHQGDRQQQVHDLITRLHSANLITVSDVDTLRSVSDDVFAKTRGELSAPALSERISSANGAAAADPSSSQVTLAVLSVVAKATTAAPPEGTVPAADPGGTTPLSSSVPSMQADEGIILEGAMLGAGVGGLLGGPIGGVVGGVLGSIIGGFIAVIDAIT